MIGEGELCGMAYRGLVGAVFYFADQWTKLFEDIVDGLHQPGAVANEAVAAAAGQTIDRAGDNEDLAVLLHGMVGRGERAAARGRLDHDNAKT